MPKSGHCLCGAIRFTYEGPEAWCAHCHCESCRRQTASPFTTFVSVPVDGFHWRGERPAVFGSSAGVRRMFCRNCGTPVAYEHDDHPDEIHLFLALLDAGTEAPRPERHDFWHERVAWVQVEDDRPKD